MDKDVAYIPRSGVQIADKMKEPMGAGPPPFFFCFIPPGGMDQREEKKIWILYFSYSFLDIDDFWRARADELMLYLIRFCIKSDPSGAKMRAHLFEALLSALLLPTQRWRRASKVSKGEKHRRPLDFGPSDCSCQSV